MLPVAVVESSVGRTNAVYSQAQERTKRHRTVESAIEPEHELVQIRLQVLLAHAVKGTVNP